MSNAADSPIAAAGTIRLGRDLTVNQLGFGAMRITRPGIWGEPHNRSADIALPRHVVGRGVNLG
jgi:aryl-alcohol dehydrogenase-like predicted oxidoreductase